MSKNINKEFLGTDDPEMLEGASAVAAKLQDRLSALKTQEAAKMAESLVAFANNYARDHELEPEQVIFGLALMTINFRETAPHGTEWFDTHAEAAWNYYEANKPKD